LYCLYRILQLQVNQAGKEIRYLFLEKEKEMKSMVRVMGILFIVLVVVCSKGYCLDEELMEEVNNGMKAHLALIQNSQGEMKSQDIITDPQTPKLENQFKWVMYGDKIKVSGQNKIVTPDGKVINMSLDSKCWDKEFQVRQGMLIKSKTITADIEKPEEKPRDFLLFYPLDHGLTFTNKMALLDFQSYLRKYNGEITSIHISQENGTKEYVIVREIKDNPSGPVEKMTIWIDPAKGYTLRKAVAQVDDNPPYLLHEYQYKRYPAIISNKDIWFPTSETLTNYDKEGKITKKQEITFSNVSLNGNITSRDADIIWESGSLLFARCFSKDSSFTISAPASTEEILKGIVSPTPYVSKPEDEVVDLTGQPKPNPPVSNFFLSSRFLMILGGILLGLIILVFIIRKSK